MSEHESDNEATVRDVLGISGAMSNVGCVVLYVLVYVCCGAPGLQEVVDIFRDDQHECAE